MGIEGEDKGTPFEERRTDFIQTFEGKNEVNARENQARYGTSCKNAQNVQRDKSGYAGELDMDAELMAMERGKAQGPGERIRPGKP